MHNKVFLLYINIFKGLILFVIFLPVQRGAIKIKLKTSLDVVKIQHVWIPLEKYLNLEYNAYC
jgi:hypothetical protein